MMKISAELSEFACHGRLSAKECAAVLARYTGNSSDMITLRLRINEVSEDLDEACKIADRKRLKKNLVKDIIHGPDFRSDRAAGRNERGAWRGLDAFRHVLEDEVEKAEGTYNGILHSILNASVRDPS